MYSLVFFLGTCLGSFYHVVGYRLPIGENWVNDHSRCFACQHELRFYELLPIFSYVLQRGRCRHCKVKIKPIYLLSEVLAGILFLIPVILYGWNGFSNGSIYLVWLVLSLFIIVGVSEFYYQNSPQNVILFVLSLLLLWQVIYLKQDFLMTLAGAGIGCFISLIGCKLNVIKLKIHELTEGKVLFYALVGYLLGQSSIFMTAIFIVVGVKIGDLFIHRVKYPAMLLTMGIFLISYCYLLGKLMEFY